MPMRSAFAPSQVLRRMPLLLTFRAFVTAYFLLQGRWCLLRGWEVVLQFKLTQQTVLAVQAQHHLDTSGLPLLSKDLWLGALCWLLRKPLSLFRSARLPSFHSLMAPSSLQSLVILNLQIP